MLRSRTKCSRTVALVVMLLHAATAQAAPDQAPAPAPTSAPAAAAPALVAPAAPAAEPSKPAPKWYDELTLNAMVEAGYTYNLNNPVSRTNGLRNFDADANSFTVNTAEVSVQKPVSAAGEVGFRADFDLGGVIALRSGSAGEKAGNFALRQGFASWIAPVGSGLRIDVGKFITMHGFEYIEAFDTPNDNYSRSLLFNYSIPFTHTGVAFSYTFSPLLKGVLEVVNGWDQAISQQKGKTVCAQLNFTPSDPLSAYFNYCGGYEGSGTTQALRQLFDLNATYKLTPVLTLGINADYGKDKGASLMKSGDDAVWYGGAVYLKAESASGYGLALRGEYFKDEGGTRTGTGAASEDLEVTVTPYVKINSRLTLRAEGRFDKSDQALFEKGDGSKGNSQATLSLNALFAF